MLKLSKSGTEGEKVYLLMESGARIHTTQASTLSCSQTAAVLHAIVYQCQPISVEPVMCATHACEMSQGLQVAPHWRVPLPSFLR